MAQIKLTLEVDLIIEIDDSKTDLTNANRILNEMNYSFEDTTGLAKIIDSQIVSYIYKD